LKNEQKGIRLKHLQKHPTHLPNLLWSKIFKISWFFVIPDLIRDPDTQPE